VEIARRCVYSYVNERIFNAVVNVPVQSAGNIDDVTLVKRWILTFQSSIPQLCAFASALAEVRC
jgi:hypothetical protein